MTSPIRSEQITVVPVGTGTWLARPKPGTGAGSNSGIVDTGHVTVVFDTMLAPSAAKDLRSAARLVTGREPSVAINSHWHLDHVMGNAVFGGSTILATETTAELEAIGVARLETALTDVAWTIRTSDLEMGLSKVADPLLRDERAAEIAARRDLTANRPLAVYRPPDQIFRDRLRFPGEKGILLVEGAGHSENDSVLFVPGEDVLYAGDLVTVETHPGLESCDLERWLVTLDRIDAIGAKTIVPGHGPVAGPEATEGVRDYLQWIRSVADGTSSRDLPERFRGWALPGRLATNLVHANPVRPDS